LATFKVPVKWFLRNMNSNYSMNMDRFYVVQGKGKKNTPKNE